MTAPLHRLPAIEPARCTGCGRCVGACSLHLLSLETVSWKKTAVLHEAQPCTGCSECAVVCPFRAIVMRAPESRPSLRNRGQPRLGSVDPASGSA